jgi:plastocyanin
MRRVIAAVCVIAGSVLVVAPPADAGGGGCHGGTTEGAGSEVRIEQACFTPTVLRVPVGAEVTFTNGDEMLHAISGTAMGYDDLSDGASVQRTFDRPGVYPYMCHLHPGMTGAVLVGEASPVLAGAARPAAPPDDDGVSSALVGAVAAFAGLAGGFLLQKRRAARA